MKKIDKALDQGMRFLMAIAMFSLVVGGFWQIFTRWVMNNPSTVTEEFMRYMLIWASMIGSAYCFYRDKHLALDLVTSRARGIVKIALNVFIELAILFFIGYVFIYGGFRLAMSSTNQSPVLHIPFKVLYMILPISGCFIYLARALKYIQMYVTRGDNQKGEEA